MDKPEVARIREEADVLQRSLAKLPALKPGELRGAVDQLLGWVRDLAGALEHDRKGPNVDRQLRGQPGP